MRPRVSSLVRQLLTLAGLVGLAGVGFGHDFWVRSKGGKPEVGKAVLLELCVGDNLVAETCPRDEKYIQRFVHRRGDVLGEVKALPGRVDPAGYFKPDANGVYVVAYEGRPRYLELEGAKFTSYLHEAGLTEVVEARAKAGTTGEPGYEEYARCAKALLEVGEGLEWAPERPFGLTLELVALSDPDGAGPFRVQLLRDGKPVVGARIVCQREVAPGAPVPEGVTTGGATPAQEAPPAEPAPSLPRFRTAKTDAEGVAEFALHPDSTWLFSAIQMRPAASAVATDPAALGKPLAWSSHWASLWLRTGAKAKS